jgi:NAD(P)-dependent dehydrogenase (short-subunit alcohol dehydrogenase family)
VTNPVIVVIGAGPGIGAAVARRFGRAGSDVALLARSLGRLEALGAELQADGITAGWTVVDVRDDNGLRAAIERFGQHAGSIQHLHFNPVAFTYTSALELSVEGLLDDVRVGVASLMSAVQAARPFLSAGARITATGGGTADSPRPVAVSLGVQKAALRNLVTALDATLAPDGIRAMSLTVAGTVKEGTPFDPTAIAETLFQAAQTEAEFWADEVRFTGSE